MAEAEVPASFGPYARGRELGRGASGTVFLCELRGAVGAAKGSVAPAPATFAAKAIDLRRLRLSAKADRELKKLQREADILKRIPPHENVVRFIDSLEEGNWFFFVLEFVGGGDLFSALVRRPAAAGRRPRFRDAEVLHVLRQLIEGLEFLHNHGVIHRDLKLENILVVQQRKQGLNLLCDVKITDFGLSKIVGDGFSLAHSTVGSPRYIAPEVLARGVHDFRADLWSLGVLLYVLLSGRFPIDGPPEAVTQSALSGSVAKLEASVEAVHVVSGLMQIDRDKRMTLSTLRRHAWLAVERSGGAAPGAETAPAKRPRQDPGPAAAAAVTCVSTIELFGSEDVQPGAPPSPREAQPLPSPEPAPPSPAPPPGLPPKALAGKPTGAASAAAVAPAPPSQALSCKEVDDGQADSGAAVRGTVVFRSDHKTGGGFHLRLRDRDGEQIDVRFWDAAASRHKSDPGLCKGAEVAFAGFRRMALKPREIPYAPPNRVHSLNYNRAEDVWYTLEPSEVL